MSDFKDVKVYRWKFLSLIVYVYYLIRYSFILECMKDERVLFLNYLEVLYFKVYKLDKVIYRR